MNEIKRFREIYALIWKANEPDETFKQEEFDSRIPKLMEWLKSLHNSGKLVACGGGGFEDRPGGLTLINSSSPEEALEMSSGNPMNEIGNTEIMIWDVFFASINEIEMESKLK